MMDEAAPSKNVAFRFIQSIIWTKGNSASYLTPLHCVLTNSCTENIPAKELHNDMTTERTEREGGTVDM
jgi:hypothetical protein